MKKATSAALAALAAACALNAATGKREFSLMNGRAPNDQPRPGDRLKIVVAG